MQVSLNQKGFQFSQRATLSKEILYQATMIREANQRIKDLKDLNTYENPISTLLKMVLPSMMEDVMEEVVILKELVYNDSSLSKYHDAYGEIFDMITDRQNSQYDLFNQ